MTFTRPDASTFTGTWNSNTNRMVFDVYPNYWVPVLYPAPLATMEVTSLGATTTVEYTHGHDASDDVPYLGYVWTWSDGTSTTSHQWTQVSGDPLQYTFMVGSQQYTMVVNDHDNDEETMQIQTGSTIFNWNGSAFVSNAPQSYTWTDANGLFAFPESTAVTVTGELTDKTLTFPDETWQADWTALGRFAHSSYDSSNNLVYRWNSVGETLYGDRYNGTFEKVRTDLQIDRIVWDLEDGTQEIWTTQPETTQYQATLTTNHDQITWNVGTAWNVDTLTPTTRTQTLTKTGIDNRSNRLYSRLQDGVSMPLEYVGIGRTLFEGSTRTGVYEDGVITWSQGNQWNAIGVPPTVVMQELEFDSGQGHTCLYLHGNGMFNGLNSRGPAPFSSSCIAKIAIDPNVSVNHMVMGRSHRYVEIPPGSLTSLSFFVKDSSGTPIDMEEMGASISFVLTVAPRD